MNRRKRDSRPGKGERKRYVGFVVSDPSINRSKLIHLLNIATGKDDVSPWLTYYEDGKGIVLCSNKNRTVIEKILKRAGGSGLAVKTIITSGTIKKVKNALSIIHEKKS